MIPSKTKSAILVANSRMVITALDMTKLLSTEQTEYAMYATTAHFRHAVFSALSSKTNKKVPTHKISKTNAASCPAAPRLSAKKADDVQYDQKDYICIKYYLRKDIFFALFCRDERVKIDKLRQHADDRKK